jgi:hypothetical protein
MENISTLYLTWFRCLLLNPKTFCVRCILLVGLDRDDVVVGLDRDDVVVGLDRDDVVVGLDRANNWDVCACMLLLVCVVLFRKKKT